MPRRVHRRPPPLVRARPRLLGADPPRAGGPVVPRLATVREAAEVARLLHDFNTEFDTPTPDVEVLAHRLSHLLGDGMTFAVLAGEPAVAVALVTMRTNV